MREICFCGRCGELEDRKPVLLESGERALECADCGDTNRANRLRGAVRADVFEESANRHARRHFQTAAP